MAHEFITSGPLYASVEAVTAFLYLQMAEQPPLQDYDPEDPEAVAAASAADELWYGPQDPSEPVVDREVVKTFIIGAGRLFARLQELQDADDLSEDTIQFEFYEYAKSTFGTDKKEIRQFFLYLYQMLTNTPNGPRWGQFVMIFGLDSFIEKMQDRFSDPLRLGGV